jgi:hypothetical protein
MQSVICTQKTGTAPYLYIHSIRHHVDDTQVR